VFIVLASYAALASLNRTSDYHRTVAAARRNVNSILSLLTIVCIPQN